MQRKTASRGTRSAKARCPGNVIYSGSVPIHLHISGRRTKMDSARQILWTGWQLQGHRCSWRVEPREPLLKLSACVPQIDFEPTNLLPQPLRLIILLVLSILFLRIPASLPLLLLTPIGVVVALIRNQRDIAVIDLGPVTGTIIVLASEYWIAVRCSAHEMLMRPNTRRAVWSLRTTLLRTRQRY